MDELLGEFLTETNESLGMLDGELVKLEQNPDNPGMIDNIFRIVHTIKGTCGFLGLPRLESVAHASENVLGKIRDNEIAVSPEIVTLILASLDRIKDLLAELEATETEPEGDDKQLIAELNAMAEGKAAAPATPEPVSSTTDSELDALEKAFQEAPGPDDAIAETSPDAGGNPVGDVLDELERAFQEAPGPDSQLDAAREEEGGMELSEAAPAETPTKPAAAKAAPAGANKHGAKSAESNIANQNIRVSVELLENLMTMVSELVLTRNQLLQMVRGDADSEFKVPLQRLSHVTTELQEGVMKTRMQPIGSAWAKLPRIVRDLSLELGKRIDLEMLGADTELDRQVLELIKDPLTHMVRNSADHGLERPKDRLKLGKNETGKIVLNAYHEGGHIIIEIRDDGRGLAVDKIRSKILEKGLATEGEIEGMTGQQIQNFIFAPGFSTAAAVTSVSGRGVGMDVVRTNIEKIGGTIDLKSAENTGTTFTIKIPLTLAIVSALVVECCGERFAMPQISVLELVRASKESEHRIETIKETPVLRLRNRLLPLVYLGDALGINDGDSKAEMNGASEMFIVVTQVGNYTFGIIVDRVFDTEEIVVKPVAPLLRDISMFSGNTILGDGSVIMILDPNGIAAATTDVPLQDASRDQFDTKSHVKDNDHVALLVFRAGGSEPKAVPLSLIARLEELDVEQIEKSNDMCVVQYRGNLMPLVRMNYEYEARQSGRQPILVFADGDRAMGLMVEEIVDIVEDRLKIELSADTPGSIGTGVINGKATEIVDVAHFLNQGFSDWFKQHDDTPFGISEEQRRILLVDDSPFFRNMLTPLLEIAGYEVTTANNPNDALQMREDGAAFDIIVSDIEMPEMNGFEFASEVRKDNRWGTTPLVALSSHANERDFARGRSVGFDDYVTKLDRENLLRALDQTLALNREAS